MRRALLGGGGDGAGQLGQVTVDDAAVLPRAGSAAARSGSFEATRFATGRKNAIRIEINGSAGQPRLRLRGHERPAVLRRDGAGRDRRLPPDPGHRARRTRTSAAWWPPGHGLGYEHGFTHQVVDLVTAIAEGEHPLPSFADGLQVQRVLGAVERSAADRVAGAHVPATTPPERRPSTTRKEHTMTRPITLFTGQWADLPFEEVCRLASGWGYDGLEIACWGDHLDVDRAAEDDAYVAGKQRDPRASTA